MPRLAETLLCSLVLAAAAARAEPAESVVCALTYGGETRIVAARPSPSPYTVEPLEFGSYLQFRIVFRTQPADLASIKLYAYGHYDDSHPLIHQATYAYPPVHDRRYGFTGLNRVYEPRYGLELEYWCELQKAPSK